MAGYDKLYRELIAAQNKAKKDGDETKFLAATEDIKRLTSSIHQPGGKERAEQELFSGSQYNANSGESWVDVAKYTLGDPRAWERIARANVDPDAFYRWRTNPEKYALPSPSGQVHIPNQWKTGAYFDDDYNAVIPDVPPPPRVDARTMASEKYSRGLRDISDPGLTDDERSWLQYLSRPPSDKEPDGGPLFGEIEYPEGDLLLFGESKDPYLPPEDSEWRRMGDITSLISDDVKNIVTGGVAESSHLKLPYTPGLAPVPPIPAPTLPENQRYFADLMDTTSAIKESIGLGTSPLSSSTLNNASTISHEEAMANVLANIPTEMKTSEDVSNYAPYQLGDFSELPPYAGDSIVPPVQKGKLRAMLDVIRIYGAKKLDSYRLADPMLRTGYLHPDIKKWADSRVYSYDDGTDEGTVLITHTGDAANYKANVEEYRQIQFDESLSAGIVPMLAFILGDRKHPIVNTIARVAAAVDHLYQPLKSIIGHSVYMIGNMAERLGFITDFSTEENAQFWTAMANEDNPDSWDIVASAVEWKEKLGKAYIELEDWLNNDPKGRHIATSYLRGNLPGIPTVLLDEMPEELAETFEGYQEADKLEQENNQNIVDELESIVQAFGIEEDRVKRREYGYAVFDLMDQRTDLPNFGQRASFLFLRDADERWLSYREGWVDWFVQTGTIPTPAVEYELSYQYANMWTEALFETVFEIEVLAPFIKPVFKVFGDIFKGVPNKYRAMMMLGRLTKLADEVPPVTEKFAPRLKYFFHSVFQTASVNTQISRAGTTVMEAFDDVVRNRVNTIGEFEDLLGDIYKYTQGDDINFAKMYELGFSNQDIRRLVRMNDIVDMDMLANRWSEMARTASSRARRANVVVQEGILGAKNTLKASAKVLGDLGVSLPKLVDDLVSMNKIQLNLKYGKVVDNIDEYKDLLNEALKSKEFKEKLAADVAEATKKFADKPENFIEKFADEFKDALRKHYTPWTKEPGMYDGVSAAWGRAFGKPPLAPWVFKGYGHIMKAWMFLVLTLRPGFVMRNFFDSMFRMVIAGGRITQSVDDLLRLMPDGRLPPEVEQRLGIFDIDGQSLFKWLADNTKAGETRTVKRALLRYAKENSTSPWNWLSALNSVSEYVASVNLFIPLYMNNYDVAVRLALDSVGSSGDELVDAIITNLRAKYGNNVQGMRQAIKHMSLGSATDAKFVSSLMIPKELKDFATEKLPSDKAFIYLRRLADSIQDDILEGFLDARNLDEAIKFIGAREKDMLAQLKKNLDDSMKHFEELAQMTGEPATKMRDFVDEDLHGGNIKPAPRIKKTAPPPAFFDADSDLLGPEEALSKGLLTEEDIGVINPADRKQSAIAGKRLASSSGEFSALRISRVDDLTEAKLMGATEIDGVSLEDYQELNNYLGLFQENMSYVLKGPLALMINEKLAGWSWLTHPLGSLERREAYQASVKSFSMVYDYLRGQTDEVLALLKNDPDELLRRLNAKEFPTLKDMTTDMGWKPRFDSDGRLTGFDFPDGSVAPTNSQIAGYKEVWVDNFKSHGMADYTDEQIFDLSVISWTRRKNASLAEDVTDTLLETQDEVTETIARQADSVDETIQLDVVEKLDQAVKTIDDYDQTFDEVTVDYVDDVAEVPTTPKIEFKDIPAGSTAQQNVESLRNTEGWKLHLTVSEDNRATVEEFLGKTDWKFKAGRSSGQVGNEEYLKIQEGLDDRIPPSKVPTNLELYGDKVYSHEPVPNYSPNRLHSGRLDGKLRFAFLRGHVLLEDGTIRELLNYSRGYYNNSIAVSDIVAFKNPGRGAKWIEMPGKKQIDPAPLTPPKDFTIYVGSKSDAQELADEINKSLDTVLDDPVGDVLGTDTTFGGKVMGRFDIRDPEFHQYGKGGVPHLKDDVMNMLYGGEITPDEASQAADDILKQRYGGFYSGVDDVSAPAVEKASRYVDDSNPAWDEPLHYEHRIEGPDSFDSAREAKDHLEDIEGSSATLGEEGAQGVALAKEEVRAITEALDDAGLLRKVEEVTGVVDDVAEAPTPSPAGIDFGKASMRLDRVQELIDSGKSMDEAKEIARAEFESSGVADEVTGAADDIAPQIGKYSIWKEKGSTPLPDLADELAETGYIKPAHAVSKGSGLENIQDVESKFRQSQAANAFYERVGMVSAVQDENGKWILKLDESLSDMSGEELFNEAAQRNYELHKAPTKEVTPPTTGKPIIGEGGREVAAQTDYANKSIKVNRAKLSNDFKNKVWTIPKVEGVAAFDEKIFSTRESWEEFVVNHEKAHFIPWVKDINDKALRENVANRLALEKTFRDVPWVVDGLDETLASIDDAMYKIQSKARAKIPSEHPDAYIRSTIPEAKHKTADEVWDAIVDKPLYTETDKTIGNTVRGLYGDKAERGFDDLTIDLRRRINNARAAGNDITADVLQFRLTQIEGEYYSMMKAAGLTKFAGPPPIPRRLIPDIFDSFIKGQEVNLAEYRALREVTEEFYGHFRKQLAGDADFFKPGQLTPDQRKLLDSHGSKVAGAMDEAHEVSVYGSQNSIGLKHLEGKEFVSALDETSRVLIDYSQYDRWEVPMRVMFPFWHFPTRSLPFWAEHLSSNPEFIAFYGRYHHLSDLTSKKYGATDTTGRQLSSFRGYFPIPGTDTWVNPMNVLSMGALFPEFDKYFQQRVEEMPPGRKALHYVYKYAPMFGFIPSPLVSMLTRPAIDRRIIPSWSMIPQFSLIKDRAIDRILMNIRQSGSDWTFFKSALNAVHPEVSWEDHLIENRILRNAMVFIQENNLNSIEAMKVVQDVALLLDVEKRYADSDLMEKWMDTRREIEDESWNMHLVGYMSGIYPKKFTDADAAFMQIRDENNILRWSLNNKGMAEIIDYYDDPLSGHDDHYLPFKFDTWKGWISSFYNITRYVEYKPNFPGMPVIPERKHGEDDVSYDARVQSHLDAVSLEMGKNAPIIGDPAYGEDRLKIVAKLMQKFLANDATWSARLAAADRRDQGLAQLPVGASWDMKAPYFEQYAQDMQDTDDMAIYDYADNPWSAGAKPGEVIEQEIIREWWYKIRSTYPTWSDEKEYEVYKREVESWRRDLPNLAKVFIGPFMRSVASRDMKGRVDLNVITKDLMEMTNHQGYDGWLAENDTVYEAVDGAFDELYIDSYHQALYNSPVGERNLAIHDWQQANPTPPPFDAIYKSVIDKYGFERFTREEIQQAYGGREIPDIEQYKAERSANPELYSTKNGIWGYLNRIPPGEMDKITDRMEKIGMDTDRFTVWYDTHGNGYDLLPDELNEFHSDLKRIVEDEFGYPEPSRQDLVTWNMVKLLDDQFDDVVIDYIKDAEAPNITTYDEFDRLRTYYYRTLTPKEQESFRNNPITRPQYQLIADVRNMEIAWGRTYPEWGRYRLKDWQKEEAEINVLDPIGWPKGLANSLGSVFASNLEDYMMGEEDLEEETEAMLIYLKNRPEYEYFIGGILDNR